MKWLRLYHDTITDPKWRLVAIDSGQTEAVVLGIWMAMLVNASDSPVRGTLHDWSDRIMGAALGLKGEAVGAVRSAMQGVVLDGDRLTGWDKRQRAADNVAERVKRHRERHKTQEKPNGPDRGGNGTETLQDDDVTLHQDDVTEIPLRATDSRGLDSEQGVNPPKAPPCGRGARLADEFAEWWERYPHKVGKLVAEKAYLKARKGGATQAELLAGLERYCQYLALPNAPNPANPSTWLNQGRWNDKPMARSGSYEQHRPVRSYGEQPDARREMLFDEYAADVERRRAVAH